MSYKQCMIDDLIPFLVTRGFTRNEYVDDGWEQWHRTFKNAGLRIVCDQQERDDQLFLNIEDTDSVTLFCTGPQSQYETAISLLIAVCESAEQRAQGCVSYQEPVGGMLFSKSFDEINKVSRAGRRMRPEPALRSDYPDSSRQALVAALRSVAREAEAECICGHSQLEHEGAEGKCIGTRQCNCVRFSPAPAIPEKVSVSKSADVTAIEDRLCDCGHPKSKHRKACGCIHVIEGDEFDKYCSCLEFRTRQAEQHEAQ